MKGLLCILLCWLVGNALSAAIDGYISGNIIGMLLMFAALQLKLFKEEVVRPAAKFLLGSMALYFVPFGVGIMVSYGEIANNALAIGVALIVSTIAVIATVGAVFQLLNKSKQ